MTVLSAAYPLDLSSGSIEQVNQSLAKIKNEIDAQYGHLNNIRTRYRGATAPTNPEAGQVWEDTVNAKIMKWTGSAWAQDIGVSINLTNRNTVLQGTVDGSGNPTLIAGDASDLTADLVATTETIIAIPAGHDATVGNLDYIVSFSATQTDFWTSLPANNTSYLFVDYSSGTVTGTYSVIAPVYQAFAPAHSAGKNWYDTNKEQWYLSDGSTWVAKYRCYVGNVVTDGTKVTATTVEPYLKLRGNLLGNVTGNVTGAASDNVLKSILTTAGDLPYATGAGVWTRLALGAANLKLFVNAAGNAPEWAVPYKIGSFTRDLSTASGAQAITGIGFKPSAVKFMSGALASPQNSHGWDDGTNRCRVGTTGTVAVIAEDYSIAISDAPGTVGQYGKIATMDADGFTVNWLKAGSGSGTYKVYYFALR